MVSRKIPIQNKKLSTEYHFPVKSGILFFVCSNLFKRYFSRVQFSVYLLASAIYKLETDLYFENILGLLVTCANWCSSKYHKTCSTNRISILWQHSKLTKWVILISLWLGCKLDRHICCLKTIWIYVKGKNILKS